MWGGVCMNDEKFIVSQERHKEIVKETCTMANLQDAIDEILENNPALDAYWFGMFEEGNGCD